MKRVIVRRRKSNLTTEQKVTKALMACSTTSDDDILDRLKEACDTYFIYHSCMKAIAKANNDKVTQTGVICALLLRPTL